MEADFPHHVLFECAALSDELRRKVQSYFQVRRKSGGGECGPVVPVRGHLYRIGFRDRADQQRVLQKERHEVDGVVLTVRDGSSSSGASPSSGPSATPDRTSAASPQEQSPTPNPAPRAPLLEEHEVPLDRYVIRYLRESPKAQKEVQERLASISCVILSVADETIRVRHEVQPGAAAGVRDWKAGVVKVFDCFVCHYEVDPRKIQALLQSRSSRPSSDGVKVYSEVGVVAVAGERSQVAAELDDLDDSLSKRKLSVARQRQTSVRRVGEAKLRLLFEDIKTSAKETFPEVEVTQGDAGQLVLSGNVEEIVNAGELISGMEDLVLERTVSDKSPHFLAFLRKVYGAPGVFASMLSVSNEVEFEIGDIELHLFSRSRNKLEETVKKIDETFKDVKFDIPNCSVVPTELLEQIRSMSNEMNQGSCRVEVVVGLDSTLWLQGHTKEVVQLSQAVTQFILDQKSIEGKSSLPFPELVQVLPDLLQQHGFDYSGVTLHPLASASGPMVALEGPHGRVTEVKNRLDPFLDTVVQERITIDLPGAARFFKSPSGKESLASIARSQKSLIQLEDQPQTQARQSSQSAKYVLQHGIEVLVIQGDMTKQYADALVNPANENLEHGGGLAAALSAAGGPQVQIESRNTVAQGGKIPVGSAVMTTSGSLKCKKLIHVVGPINGQVGGRERPLLEKGVQSALDLAETMNFKSIAIPCISSGLFGMPLRVCSEAIVTAVKTFGSQAGRSLTRIILIDSKADVVLALLDACDRLLKEGAAKVENGAAAQDTARRASARLPRKEISIEPIYGTIESQQVDALVSPLAGLKITSTRVGIALSNAAGPQLKTSFDQAVAAAGSKPGDVFVVENLTALKCKTVIFIWLSAWDNTDSPAQVLRQGIRETLSTCDGRGFTSVAFPLLGTGQVLNCPPDVASKILLEEIRAFEQQRNNQKFFAVRVIIHPKNKDYFKAFKGALDAVQSGGARVAAPVAGTFYRCTSKTTDKLTAMLGNVALQMLQGDITRAGTDVVVNTTDFTNKGAGVCKAILTAAGPSVDQELATLGIPSDLICSTGPGLLGCKEIIHATFRSDTQIIRKNCKKILKLCEQKGHQSVAFPAVNTGLAGMDASKVCKAMLDGMATAIKDLNPQSLSLIRFVIMQPTVFKAFRTELESRFGQDAPSYTSMREKAKQKLKKWQEKQPGTLPPSVPQVQTILSLSKPPRAVMSVISCGSDVIKTVKAELESELQKHQFQRQVDVKFFSRLDQMEVEALKKKIKTLEVSLEHRKSQVACSGPYMTIGPGSAEEIYVLKGLKEDVLSVVELINKSIHKVLHNDLQDKEEAILALTVQWSIKDSKGAWQELSLHDNYKLEEANITKKTVVDVMAPTGMAVSVDVKKQEATDSQTGNKYQVKRIQSETALVLPPHWEPMNDEIFKKVELQKQSQEYKDIEQGFKKTANYAIQKIERVQNVYLWHAFSVCKERIIKKNGLQNLGEKLLYHGTSAESCNCIERDRFDRNYAGAHAALYGKGVYFAVNAQYSASKYSPADKAGLKRLYAARVFTGRFTAGKSSMVAPPPRGTDPTDCYDSLVDKLVQPTMFVVFHDDQAYPEYLITFK